MAVANVFLDTLIKTLLDSFDLTTTMNSELRLHVNPGFDSMAGLGLKISTIAQVQFAAHLTFTFIH